MKITKEQIAFLHPYVKALSAIVFQNKLDPLLSAIDDAILNNMVEHDEAVNEEGEKLKEIRDTIAKQNQK